MGFILFEAVHHYELAERARITLALKLIKILVEICTTKKLFRPRLQISTGQQRRGVFNSDINLSFAKFLKQKILLFG